ncbi:MAG: PAC2 family protein [Chloroflexota bacterium]
MRAGAFELKEPLPELRGPHAFAMLRPWIDVGGVGSGVMAFLENHLNAQGLGGLRRPGLFYDFTRYRPTVFRVGGQRQIRIPNTYVSYAHGEGDHDFLFLHCLEPHMLGETYAYSVLTVLEKLGAKKYITVGSMYDSVPHTRPMLVSGSASTPAQENLMDEVHIGQSTYQGPTTINILVADRAPHMGIETMTMVVHLPSYAQLEEDFTGQHTILSLLCRLFGFSMNLDKLQKKGQEQYRELDMAIKGNSQVEELVRLMEMNYDARAARHPKGEEGPRLSPEIERFLREVDQGPEGG